jgi:hypothetical protein
MKRYNNGETSIFQYIGFWITFIAVSALMIYDIFFHTMAVFNYSILKAIGEITVCILTGFVSGIFIYLIIALIELIAQNLRL